jgi:hypothetical protein
MKSASRFLSLTVLALAFLGMAHKPPGITVRFFVEANKQDSETFSTPVTLKNPPRHAFIEKIPAVSERSFRAIFPFRAADGTWGCAFKLDDQGRLDLDTVSGSKRGYAIVPLIVTKAGHHQFSEMVIDRPVKDGIISIPNDVTELEMAELRKVYPVIGERPKNGEKPKKGRGEKTPAPGGFGREE